MTFFKWLIPNRHKEDPTVAQIAKGIEDETVRLNQAISNLDNEVVSMQTDRLAMNDVLDEVINAVASRTKRRR